ncbi:MAG: mechanosensitive ion channel family protein [Victivallales bacterium]|nr:mechanosensitive ion channel family protein [Victivallales bacterium]
MLEKLLQWYNHHYLVIDRVTIIIFVGVVVLFLLNTYLRIFLKKRLSPQTKLILYKLINYGGFIIIALTVLNEFNVHLAAIFGAAGIAAVAIGFAAQNSLSNIISGLFLLWEKPFKIGDLVKTEGQAGVVYSMDLLSVNLRTFDNLLIRIPNEKLMKATFVNVTRFPIRRMDLTINIAYKDDVEHAFEVLRDIARRNPYCLDEPEPLLLFRGFMDSSQEILFGVWFEKSDYVVLRNSILKEVKRRFDEEGIEIPFPHRMVYAGTVSQPFPVEMLAGLKNEPRKNGLENDKTYSG